MTRIARIAIAAGLILSGIALDRFVLNHGGRTWTCAPVFGSLDRAITCR